MIRRTVNSSMRVREHLQSIIELIKEDKCGESENEIKTSKRGNFFEIEKKEDISTIGCNLALLSVISRSQSQPSSILIP